MDQNLLTPWGELSSEIKTWTFDSHVIRSCTLKLWQIAIQPDVGQMHVDRIVTELRKGFSLEKVFIIQGTEMGRFIIEKLLYQINKRENCNILCLQAFKLALKVGRQSSTTCSLFAGSLSSGGKIVLPFTTCSSSSNQTQNSRVEYKKKIKQLKDCRDFLLAGKKKTINESFR